MNEIEYIVVSDRSDVVVKTTFCVEEATAFLKAVMECGGSASVFQQYEAVQRGQDRDFAYKPNPPDEERDLAHEADMHRLHREQLAGDFGDES